MKQSDQSCPEKHNGIVAVLINPSGRIVTKSVVFDNNCINGFCSMETQKNKAKSELALNLALNFCVEDYAKAIPEWMLENIMSCMCENSGYRIEMIEIGYGE